MGGGAFESLSPSLMLSWAPFSAYSLLPYVEGRARSLLQRDGGA